MIDDDTSGMKPADRGEICAVPSRATHTITLPYLIAKKDVIVVGLLAWNWYTTGCRIYLSTKGLVDTCPEQLSTESRT